MRVPTFVDIQRWWLFLFLICIPFSTGYIVEAPIAFSYINLFSLVFIGLGLINGLRGVIPFKPVKEKGSLMVMGLLFAVMAYALLFTDPLRNGIGLWGSRLIQPALVGYFVYVMLQAAVLRVEELVAALFLSLIPQIIGGALQTAHVIPYQDTNRVTVAYRWPNTFARYIMLLLLISFPWILAKVTSKYQKSAWTLWGLGVLLLLLSISYNGTVSFFAALVCVMMLLPKRYVNLKKWGIGLILLGGLVVAVNAPKLPKWEASITSSRETRLEFWHVAVGAIKDHPLTGIGLKTWEQKYPELFEKYGTPPRLSETSLQPHNFFLDSLLKAGVAGLVAILLFVLWPGLLGWRLIRRLKFEEMGWFGLSGIGVAIASILFGAIDDPLWSDDIMPLFFILVFALSYCYSRWVNKVIAERS